MLKSYIEKVKSSIKYNAIKKQVDDCMGSHMGDIANKGSLLIENAQQLQAQFPSFYGEAEKKWESVARCELHYLIFAAFGCYLTLFGTSLLSILVFVEAIRFTGILDKAIRFLQDDTVIQKVSTQIAENFGKVTGEEEEKIESSPAKEGSSHAGIAVQANESKTILERIHAKCVETDHSTLTRFARDGFIASIFILATLRLQVFKNLLIIAYISDKLTLSPAMMIPDHICSTLRVVSNGKVPQCFLYPRVILLSVFVVLNVMFPVVVQAFFVSLYGADILLKNAYKILNGMTFVATQEPTEVVVLLSAALGASWQLKHPDALPIVLRLIFTLPLCAEWLVRCFVQHIN